VKRRTLAETDQSSFTGGILVSVLCFVPSDAAHQDARVHKGGMNKTRLERGRPGEVSSRKAFTFRDTIPKISNWLSVPLVIRARDNSLFLLPIIVYSYKSLE
jgi:hypothetical protein